MAVGSVSGILGGLLLEHIGVRKTGYVALSTTLSPLAILVTLQYPQNFNGALFIVLILLYFVIGMSVCLTLKLVLTIPDL